MKRIICGLVSLAALLFASCQKADEPVTGISLNATKLTMRIDEEVRLVATIEPKRAQDKTVVWSAEPADVVSVQPNGVVKALKPGKTVVTATAVDGGLTAQCDVAVEGICIDELDQQHCYLQKSDSLSFSVSCAYDYTVTSSSDIVTVKQNADGTWTATANETGNVTITARLNDGTESGFAIDVVGVFWAGVAQTVYSTSFFAGQNLQIDSNREVEWSYIVKTPGLTEVLPTTVISKPGSDGTELFYAVLGHYTDSDGRDADCDIEITATDEYGFTKSFTVTAKAWTPVLYLNDEKVTDPSNIDYGVGDEFLLAIVDAQGSKAQFMDWVSCVTLGGAAVVCMDMDYCNCSGFVAKWRESLTQNKEYAIVQVEEGMPEPITIEVIMGQYTQIIDFKGNSPEL